METKSRNQGLVPRLVETALEGDFRFWAQFIRKSVNHRVMQFHFNPSETLPRIAKNEEVSVTV